MVFLQFCHYCVTCGYEASSHCQHRPSLTQKKEESVYSVISGGTKSQYPRESLQIQTYTLLALDHIFGFLSSRESILTNEYKII